MAHRFVDDGIELEVILPNGMDVTVRDELTSEDVLALLPDTESTVAASFHVSHNQKTHGRTGVNSKPVKGDANAVHAAARQRLSHAEQAASTGTDHDRAVMEAYQDYAGWAYQDVNGAARSPKDADDETLSMVGHMDDAIAEHGVINAQGITTYRGITGEHASELRDQASGTHKFGDEPRFINDGYTSVTTNRSVAAEFAGDDGVILVLTIKSGSRGLAGNPHEDELIYGRGADMTLFGYNADTNTIVAGLTA